MAVKKSGLGKGLDSLIADKVSTRQVVKTVEKDNNGEPVKISITKVEPNREQPRKKFDEESLQELADSIKQYGILQPLLVQKKEDYYEIVAGERRWRAAKIAGVKEVPVIIKSLSDRERMEISLIENIQREDLNPIEEALAYKRLIEDFNLKQDELAEKVGRSRTVVTNSLRLLKLDERVQQMVIDGRLSNGHARALLALEDHTQQYEAALKICEQQLSVRETEKMVKNLQTPKKPKEKQKLNPTLDAVYRSLEEQMKKVLGTKVKINSRNEKSGKIEIEYYSQEELEKIIDMIRGNE